MAKAFASQGDMTEKKITFDEIGEGLYAFTAEGDPNSGVIIGDDSVMIVEAQATPRLANKVIECVRSVTDKPISHVVLTHYHAVRVLGASAFGAQQVIMGDTAARRIGHPPAAIPAAGRGRTGLDAAHGPERWRGAAGGSATTDRPAATDAAACPHSPAGAGGNPQG